MDCGCDLALARVHGMHGMVQGGPVICILRVDRSEVSAGQDGGDDLVRAHLRGIVQGGPAICIPLVHLTEVLAAQDVTAFFLVLTSPERFEEAILQERLLHTSKCEVSKWRCISVLEHLDSRNQSLLPDWDPARFSHTNFDCGNCGVGGYVQLRDRAS